jgi:hypothetical protein
MLARGCDRGILRQRLGRHPYLRGNARRYQVGTPVPTRTRSGARLGFPVRGITVRGKPKTGHPPKAEETSLAADQPTRKSADSSNRCGRGDGRMWWNRPESMRL